MNARQLTEIRKNLPAYIYAVYNDSKGTHYFNHFNSQVMAIVSKPRKGIYVVHYMRYGKYSFENAPTFTVSNPQDVAFVLTFLYVHPYFL